MQNISFSNNSLAKTTTAESPPIVKSNNFHELNHLNLDNLPELLQIIAKCKEAVDSKISLTYPQTPIQKLSLMQELKNEILDDNNLSIPIKRKLESLVNIEIGRFTFAEKVAVSNVSHFSSMKSPAEDCWRLVMDGSDQESAFGIYRFENEQGYMAGMLRGLDFMIETLNDSLSPELYCQLHDTAVDQVYHVNNKLQSESITEPIEPSSWNHEETISKGYPQRGFTGGFSLTMGDNCTEEGIAELLEKTVKIDGWYRLSDDKKNFSILGRKNVLSYEDCFQKSNYIAKEIIDTYHSEIAQAQLITNPAEKETAILTCIAKCCQDLDQYHLFSDGNIRTIVFLTMNKLLIQNGLSPTIMHNPNAVDMQSISQIVELIREGQKTFQSYC